MQIPVNPQDLPTEYSVLDDTLVYRGLVKEMKLNEKADKNDTPFFKLSVEVQEPEEFRGKVVFDNYIAVPGTMLVDGELVVIPEHNLSPGEARRRQDQGVRLGRLGRALKLGADFDTEDALGRELSFTVANEEYQGRLNSKIKDYLI